MEITKVLLIEYTIALLVKYSAKCVSPMNIPSLSWERLYKQRGQREH